MRVRYFLALAAGALLLVMVAPPTARACHWWGHHRPAYGPMYYAPAPAYYAPPMYAAPAPGPYLMPGPMPPVPTVPAPPATAAAVAAADDRFDPPTLTVQPGTTVKWTNAGKHPHTVTVRGGKFDSGDVAPGGTYSVTFQTPGTYRYYCKHHKGMEGTIVVGQPGPSPSGGAKGAGY